MFSEDLGKLDRIRLAGYRSIREMDLELGRLNVFIGPNGAGKSNLIDFFRLMNRLLNKELQLFVAEQGYAEALLHFGHKTTREISACLLFGREGYGLTLVPSEAGGGLLFKEEFCVSPADLIGYTDAGPGVGGDRKEPLAQAGDLESGLPSRPESHSTAGCVTRHVRDWKIYHFHDTSATARLKKPGSIHDDARLHPQGDNLAAFLYSIRETREYRRIVQNVQRVAPFLRDFDLRPEKANPDQIRLRFEHRGSESSFDASALSDGTLRFICLSTLLLQPELPAMILLDEPELGLHPYALQLLAGMMRSASHETQIIASTQSVTLANQFDWRDLVIVERHDDTTQFRRLQKEQVEHWLDDYGIGDLWEKNLIGGTPPC